MHRVFCAPLRYVQGDGVTRRLAVEMAVLGIHGSVLVDSGVIVRAPVRYLVAGMGDALSTWYEARAAAAAGHGSRRRGRHSRGRRSGRSDRRPQLRRKGRAKPAHVDCTDAGRQSRRTDGDA